MCFSYIKSNLDNSETRPHSDENKKTHFFKLGRGIKYTILRPDIYTSAIARRGELYELKNCKCCWEEMSRDKGFVYRKVVMGYEKCKGDDAITWPWSRIYRVLNKSQNPHP